MESTLAVNARDSEVSVAAAGKAIPISSPDDIAAVPIRPKCYGALRLITEFG